MSILNKTLTSVPAGLFSGVVVSYNISLRKVTAKDFILVEKMGGTIAVESKLGEGSCFTVVLPFKINTNAKPEEKEDFHADISGVRILLVEDNELNAEIAEFMLAENGAEVETVNNGLEAVQRFEAPTAYCSSQLKQGTSLIC